MLKYYDMSIFYHPRLANVVIDALSILSINSASHIEDEKKEFARDLHRLAQFDVRFVDSNDGGVIVQNGSESSLM